LGANLVEWLISFGISFPVMKRFFLLLLLSATCLKNGNAQSPADEQAIRTLLKSQITAWNKGQIDEYMAAGYWQSDSLVFIGKNGPKYGYATTLANYKKSYPDQEHMGELSFEIISLKPLSPDYYFAVGKWFLKRAAGDVGGSWTLLFRKIGGKWKIVADHSS